MSIKIPVPSLQIDFAALLLSLRSAYLGEALSRAVGELDIQVVDSELIELVGNDSLSKLAARGLRGELVYAVPSVLRRNPRLLGYYRLLLGFSQKEFYKSSLGTTSFKAMEMEGVLGRTTEIRLRELCLALVGSARSLCDGIGYQNVDIPLLDDLQLLTLGPQLRGGANVKRGAAAILAVFELIRSIVHASVESEDVRSLTVRNAAGRLVRIEIASDPDLVITEELSASRRLLIAVEVKGGTDFSNIHNRIGEAEKSHQKARRVGYTECWTIVNVDRFDEDIARRESPSTDRFYRLPELLSPASPSGGDFRDRVIALTGIPSKPTPRRKRLSKP